MRKVCHSHDCAWNKDEMYRTGHEIVFMEKIMCPCGKLLTGVLWCMHFKIFVL